MASPRGQKESLRNFVPVDCTEGKGKSKTQYQSNEGAKGKGYAAEEASLPETVTQDNQWQEPAETLQHETWQAGAGHLNLAGKSPKFTTKNGKTLRIGSLSPVGLLCLFTRTSLRWILRAVLAACRAA